MTRAVEEIEAPRRTRALQLKINGNTYARIAEAEGYSSPAQAYRAVKLAMRNLPQHESAAELRTIILERRETVHRALAQDALVGKDRDAMRLLLSNLDGIAKLAGLNVNEARMAGAAEVSAVADLAAASMLQSSLIGVLHEVGLPVETIDLVVAKLNERLAAAEPAGVEPEAGDIEGETE